MSNAHNIKHKNQSNIKRLRKTSKNFKFFAIIDVSMYVIIKFDEKNLVIVQKFFANQIFKSFTNDVRKFFAEKMFNIIVIKNNFINVVIIVDVSTNKVLFIIKSSMNFDFEINSNYHFRD